MNWPGVERILITEQEIAQRVGELSRELERDFSGRDLVVVAVLNGTVLFLADLIRQLDLPLRIGLVQASSYRGGVTEPGNLRIHPELVPDVQGRHVLLLDDILDTGKTLNRVRAKLLELKPRCLKICVLLEKAVRRVEKVKADYIGFSIPDLFVVGYGLDFAEGYRNLPFIGVLRQQSLARSP